jgi:hypothetical protein
VSARTFEVADGFEANCLFAGNGWTDGCARTFWCGVERR